MNCAKGYDCEVYCRQRLAVAS